MAETRIIEACTHGRFLVEWGPPERLLVGFHGYGENADESLAQMLRIPGAGDWTVVAVQALHRFYRGRGSGTIAASWMTSQDRERAIVDNIDYVRSVVAEFPAPRRLGPPQYERDHRPGRRSAARRRRPHAAHPHRPRHSRGVVHR